MTICVVASEDEFLAQASLFASEHNYVLGTQIHTEKFNLVFAEQVSLHAPKSYRLNPLKVDFLSGKAKHRFYQDDGFRQPLARAIGAKANNLPHVLDATAGLGSDAFVMASLGCKVTMLERNVVLAELLKDGLLRAQKNTAGRLNQIFNNMSLIVGDTIKLNLDPEITPEVVYLDPMFKENSKRRLPGKTMQYFREIVGADQDVAQLLEKAKILAKKRVAVKRSVKDSFLNSLEPSHQILGKTTRYDVYMT